MTNKPETGDWYEWHGIYTEVGEIDPEGRWAMIHCSVRRDPAIKHAPGSPQFYVHMWDKQQPTLDGVFPSDWVKIKKPPEWVQPRDTSKTGWDTPSQPGGAYRAYPDGSDSRRPLEAI
jgi:hypothetical protein